MLLISLNKNVMLPFSHTLVSEGLAYSTDGSRWAIDACSAPDGLYLTAPLKSGVLVPASLAWDKFPLLKHPAPDSLAWGLVTETSAKHILDAFAYVSDDETRPHMNGVYLDTDNGRVAGTDGRRLVYHKVSMPLPPKGGAIINSSSELSSLLKGGKAFANALLQVAYLGGVNATSTVVFRRGTAVLYVPTNQSQFPDIDRVVPTEAAAGTIELPPVGTLEAIKTAMSGQRYRFLVFCPDGSFGVSRPVEWAPNPQDLPYPGTDPAAANPDYVRVFGTTKNTGKVAARFDLDYVLTARKQGAAALSFTDPLKTMWADVGTGKHVIMPLRLD